MAITVNRKHINQNTCNWMVAKFHNDHSHEFCRFVKVQAKPHQIAVYFFT